MATQLDGTLFRFPLRSEAAAAASDIKGSATGPGDVIGLFGALKEVLPQALLFLKGVRSVEVLVLGGGSGKERGAEGAAPRMLYRAEVQQPGECMRRLWNQAR